MAQTEDKLAQTEDNLAQTEDYGAHEAEAQRFQEQRDHARDRYERTDAHSSDADPHDRVTSVADGAVTFPESGGDSDDDPWAAYDAALQEQQAEEAMRLAKFGRQLPADQTAAIQQDLTAPPNAIGGTARQAVDKPIGQAVDNHVATRQALTSVEEEPQTIINLASDSLPECVTAPAHCDEMCTPWMHCADNGQQETIDQICSDADSQHLPFQGPDSSETNGTVGGAPYNSYHPYYPPYGDAYYPPYADGSDAEHSNTSPSASACHATCATSPDSCADYRAMTGPGGCASSCKGLIPEVWFCQVAENPCHLFPAELCDPCAECVSYVNCLFNSTQSECDAAPSHCEDTCAPWVHCAETSNLEVMNSICGGPSGGDYTEEFPTHPCHASCTALPTNCAEFMEMTAPSGCAGACPATVPDEEWGDIELMFCPRTHEPPCHSFPPQLCDACMDCVDFVDCLFQPEQPKCSSAPDHCEDQCIEWAHCAQNNELRVLEHICGLDQPHYPLPSNSSADGVNSSGGDYTEESPTHPCHASCTALPTNCAEFMEMTAPSGCAGACPATVPDEEFAVITDMFCQAEDELPCETFPAELCQACGECVDFAHCMFEPDRPECATAPGHCSNTCAQWAHCTLERDNFLAIQRICDTESTPAAEPNADSGYIPPASEPSATYFPPYSDPTYFPPYSDPTYIAPNMETAATENVRGTAATENVPGSTTTENMLGMAAAENALASTTTENVQGSTETESIQRTAATENVQESTAAAENVLGTAASENVLGSAAAENVLERRKRWIAENLLGSTTTENVLGSTETESIQRT
eukprot:SAG31_NODE_1283_length_9011_cov_2.475202_11_plen_814_part_01